MIVAMVFIVQPLFMMFERRMRIFFRNINAVGERAASTNKKLCVNKEEEIC